MPGRDAPSRSRLQTARIVARHRSVGAEGQETGPMGLRLDLCLPATRRFSVLGGAAEGYSGTRGMPNTSWNPLRARAPSHD